MIVTLRFSSTGGDAAPSNSSTNAQPKRTNVPTPQTQSRFFSIPAELRNQIYEEYLRPHSAADGSAFYYRYSWCDREKHLSLLLAYRQIHEEAAGIHRHFIENHHFHVRCSDLRSHSSLLHAKSPFRHLRTLTIYVVEALRTPVRNFKAINEILRKNHGHLRTLEIQTILIADSVPLRSLILDQVRRYARPGTDLQQPFQFNSLTVDYEPVYSSLNTYAEETREGMRRLWPAWMVEDKWPATPFVIENELRRWKITWNQRRSTQDPAEAAPEALEYA